LHRKISRGGKKGAELRSVCGSLFCAALLLEIQILGGEIIENLPVPGDFPLRRVLPPGLQSCTFLRKSTLFLSN
jgi:hypothetical protein